MLLQILSLFPSGWTVYLLFILRCKSLASHIDSSLGLQAWFFCTERTAIPSTPRRTCLHTPSACLFSTWSTARQWMQRLFSWEHCSCIWLVGSHAGCYGIVGMWWRCRRAWSWEVTAVSFPFIFGGMNAMCECRTYCLSHMAMHKQPFFPPPKSDSN